MTEPNFALAHAALRRLEDEILSVTRLPFGGVYQCPQAPSLEPFNFVRVDEVGEDLGQTVGAARRAAHDHRVTTIVLDDPSLNANLAFERAAPDGQWVRIPRWIYVCKDAPPPATIARRITIEEFTDGHSVFFEQSDDFSTTNASEEEAAVRLVAANFDTQHWGVFSNGRLVCVGETYFIGDVAQLESLSTLPMSERNGFATDITAARARYAFRRDPKIVFAQIGADNERSINLHERLGFTRTRPRTTFRLV